MTRGLREDRTTSACTFDNKQNCTTWQIALQRIKNNMQRRAKPLLGTFVEIAVDCEDDAEFIRVTELAFVRITSIHTAMSFHDAASDVRAIARAVCGDVVVVSSDTWNVLALSLEMEAATHGLFNPAIAPALVAKGLLPHPNLNERGLLELPMIRPLADSVTLLDADTTTNSNANIKTVQVLHPTWIDVGGIAKGYAVDEAVVALQRQGVKAGVVNAGGDLRVFGVASYTVSLRMPNNPVQTIAVAELTELSCATSGGYFHSGNALSNHAAIVGDRHELAAKFVSVTVIAPRCAVADALTKVLWLSDPMSQASQALQERFGARMVLIDDGVPPRIITGSANQHDPEQAC